MGDVFIKGPVELRLGDYREVLADVEPDAVITDPPYSERTHAGHDAGTAAANRVSASDAKRMRTDRRTGAVYAVGEHRRREIAYDHWSSTEVLRFCREWGVRCHGWVVPLTSHDLVGEYTSALESAARYVFQPIPCVIPGMTVRLGGDGPSSWAVYAVPARPKTRGFQRWGTLDGAYWGARGEHAAGAVVAGAKPLRLMRALVRDYSRPGDLVCDPCAGGATTLIAAALEGRRAIGAELDPETFAKACARIERTALTPPLPGIAAPRRMEQAGLKLDGDAAE